MSDAEPSGFSTRYISSKKAKKKSCPVLSTPIGMCSMKWEQWISSTEESSHGHGNLRTSIFHLTFGA
jgi:hypothetical protein